MKAELKEIDIIDALEFEKCYSFSNQPIILHAQLIIGDDKNSGGDVFNISLANSAWAREFINWDTEMLGRGLHLVECFNYNKLFEIFYNAIIKIEGNSWEDIVSKLYFFGVWEYE